MALRTTPPDKHAMSQWRGAIVSVLIRRTNSGPGKLLPGRWQVTTQAYAGWGPGPEDNYRNHSSVTKHAKRLGVSPDEVLTFPKFRGPYNSRAPYAWLVPFDTKAREWLDGWTDINGGRGTHIGAQTDTLTQWESCYHAEPTTTLIDTNLDLVA